MTSNQFNWKQNIWPLIDNYFQTTKNYISHNQLDSYNIFLKNQIPKTIRQFNPMIFTKGEHEYFDHADNKKIHYIHKIEFIIGGTLSEDGEKVFNDGKGIYLSKPIIQELVKESIHIHKDTTTATTDAVPAPTASTAPTAPTASTAPGAAPETATPSDAIVSSDSVKDVRVKQLFPNEARLKNLTYSSLISCDIFIIITNVKIVNKQPVLYKGKVQVYKEIPLGNIPIMVQSNLCVLSDKPKPILYEMGECIYDQGGYFIINGKEKVIINQERQVENRIYINKNKVDPTIQYELKIRSVPENIFQPARITTLYMTDTNAIYVRIPHCNALKLLEKDSGASKVTNYDIPLFLLFRALGVVSDKDIVRSIIDINNSSLSKNVMDILRNSIYEQYDRAPVFTQHDALLELSRYVNVLNKNTIPPDNMKLIMLQNILRNYFIPHVGKMFKEKGLFLAHMVKELILVKLNIRTITDKDNFMNKRVDTAGYLIGTIFRDLYFRVKNNLRDNLNRAYAGIKPTLKEADAEWSKSLGDEETHRTQLDNFIGHSSSTTSIIKINELFQQHIMNDGFLYAFKNCWGLKNARGCKQGIVQDLNRLSFLGYLSHLRRLNTSIPSGAKIRAPHSLHSSTYGIICPCETPDGGNIGLRKNLAISAKITFGTNSDSFMKLLYSLHLISIYDIEDKNINRYTKIFLNEKIIGYHEYPKQLCYMLRLYKRNALINIYTSISWYIIDNIVKVSTTSGRCCRPLLVIKNNTCLLTDSHIQSIKDKAMNWKHLIGGTRTLDMKAAHDTKEPYIDDNNLLIEFNKKNYTYVSSKDMSLQECLEYYSGVIEYVDTEEANNSLIALTPHDLETSHLSRYNYCEIHPTMLFGIIANNIPLLERNQAPRNQFATVHGKQALGVYATNFKNRMDTKVQVMFYPQRPIIQSIYSKYLFTDQIPHGINTIVAVACYSGYNQEDSLIFNKSSIERGLFRTVKFRTYSEREEINNSGKNKEEICFPDERFTRNMKIGNYGKLDKKTGIIPENTHVNDSDIVVGKVMYTGEKDINGNKLYSDNSLIVKRHESGIIDKIHYNTGNDDQNYIKLRLRKDKMPEIGDKFCSRFGQKGTIGMVLPAEDMPFTKNGIVPDIIMNPHALPSRMTLGQILEVIMGKVSVESGKIAKLASFSNINEPVIGDILEELGYEKCANEVLYNGIDGTQLKVNIFMGPTYYQRLVHQVADKMNSRTTGPQTSLAHQPVGGRSIGGGLRIGEMERDSLLAHGMSYFIKESFMERADKYSFYISNKSGLLAIVNKEKKIFEDFSKDETKIKVNREGNIEKFSNKISDADFICVEAPYTFKLFLQEIESMGVALRLVTSDICKQWETMTDGAITLHDTLSLQDSEEAVHHIPNVSTTIKEKKSTTEPSTTTNQYYTGKTSHLIRPLNKFHNKIKELLLDNKSNNLCNITDTHKALLDTSVGRGGDLWKWYNYNYTTVLGFDIDMMGIENTGEGLGGDGAKKRLHDMKTSGTADQKKWARQSKIFFAVADTSKDIRQMENVDDSYVATVREAYRYMPENSFDVVSSQFTVHYYFENETHIKQYLQNVQTNIKKDGYLLITCLDGESVYNLLKQHKETTGQTTYEGIVNDPITGKTKVWGINGSELDLTRESLSNHTFKETIKVYYESIGQEQEEYLVHKQHLIELASTYNLFLISDTESQTNFNILQHGSDMFKNVYEPIKRKYKRNRHLTSLGHYKNKNLKNYSDLHRYYIFKYIPDISDERRGLLLNQSLEIVQRTQDIKTNPYAIKYSYMPEHLIDSFTKSVKQYDGGKIPRTITIKNNLEDKHNGSIIVYEHKETKLNKLSQQEQLLKQGGTIEQSRNKSSIANTDALVYNLQKQEKYEESLYMCEELIKILDSEFGKGHSKVKELMKTKYILLIQLERYEDSVTIIKELLTLLASIDLTLQMSQLAAQVRKDKAILTSYLAYNYYKLNNMEQSIELYDELHKNIHTIFNTKEKELYEIQLRECEILLSRSVNYIESHNTLVTIIQDIHAECNDKEIKYELLEQAFSLLYQESTNSITMKGVIYNKMAIIGKKSAISHICLDISTFRQDNIIDQEHSVSFGVIIPYYDEDEDVVYSEKIIEEGMPGPVVEKGVGVEGDEDVEDVEGVARGGAQIDDISTEVTGALYDVSIKPDSNIDRLLKNVKELYKNELELGSCSIYIVKQTKKEIDINEELYHKNSFYNINDEETRGYLKYNKGALINTGYTFAKRDQKKYMIIMNANVHYDPTLTSIMTTYPNQPEFIGRLKNTSNIEQYIMDIIKINVNDYELINGSPNDIWDPSLSDKIVYNRIKRNTKLKPTSMYINNTDERIQLVNDTAYEHSIDYRRTKDYLYLDKQSQPFSGISQLHNVDIVHTSKISSYITLLDVDFTVETKPFEIYELDEATGVYNNVLYTIFNTIDITQSSLDIVTQIYVRYIKYITGIRDIDIRPVIHMVELSMHTHLYNNIFKSLYVENRLKYILQNISYVLSLFQEVLLQKKINDVSFDNYDSIFRMDYTYHPLLGFSIYMYEEFKYYYEYKHILDKIYEHRNKVDTLKNLYTNSTETFQSTVDTFAQSNNLQVVDIIQNNIIYKNLATQLLEHYIVKINTQNEETSVVTYTIEQVTITLDESISKEEKEEKESRFELIILNNPNDIPGFTDDDLVYDPSNRFIYINYYNTVYHSLRDNIHTEYTNKLNVPLFSEEMSKDYFNPEKKYDGLQFGYKENIMDFNRFETPLFKKSYRLGILYNQASNFVVRQKANIKQIKDIQTIIQHIDTLDKEMFCDSNTQAKHIRHEIVELYKDLLQQAEYSIEPVPEPSIDLTMEPVIDPSIDSTEEDTEVVDTRSDKLYKPGQLKTLAQPEQPEQSDQSDQSDQPEQPKQGGGSTYESEYFSINHMQMIQKGGNKNNVIGVRKKILYLLKGLPVKYIKLFQFDVEALYSVTKYIYANKISKLLLNLKGIDHTSTILECMSCVGGNAISFLQYFNTCVFVEKDSNKVDMLTNNINNLSQHISKKMGHFTIVNDDINTLITYKKKNILNQSYDIVFIDPPWGGKHYKYSKNIKIKIDTIPLFDFIEMFKDISRYVVLKLPFNYDIKHLENKLHTGFEIIEVHDIKNSKDKIKMKIVIIELTKKNIFTPENILNNIKKMSTISNTKNVNIELEIDTDTSSGTTMNTLSDIHNKKYDTVIDDIIDKSIFNIKDNMIQTDTLHIPDPTYKHITIRNVHKNNHSHTPNTVQDIGDNVREEANVSNEYREHDDYEQYEEGDEECTGHSTNPIDDDIQSINSVFSDPSQKNVKRIRIIKHS